MTNEFRADITLGMSIEVRRALAMAVTVTFWLCVGMPVRLHGASVTLVPSADTTLMQSDPANNMGAVQSVAIGVTGHRTAARGLMRFDLSGIPIGATVTEVRLTIPVIREPLGVKPAICDLHRVLVDWGEGTKGAGALTASGGLATSGEATWTARRLGQADWAAAGGAAGLDFVGAASGSGPAEGSLYYSGAGVVADVQYWVTTPASNFGWLIKDSAEVATEQTARRFVSREFPVGQPQMVVTYSTTPILRIVEPVRLGDQVCFKFAPAAGKSYAVERSSRISGGDWTEIQSFPSGDGREQISVCDALASGPVFYRVVER